MKHLTIKLHIYETYSVHLYQKQRDKQPIKNTKP